MLYSVSRQCVSTTRSGRNLTIILRDDFVTTSVLFTTSVRSAGQPPTIKLVPLPVHRTLTPQSMFKYHSAIHFSLNISRCVSVSALLGTLTSVYNILRVCGRPALQCVLDSDLLVQCSVECPECADMSDSVPMKTRVHQVS